MRPGKFMLGLAELLRGGPGKDRAHGAPGRDRSVP
jgi:hypothetical protein